MNSQHKAIRANLTSMAPKRAIDYIRAFELPEDEERYLIDCDVRNKSYVQVAMEYNVSLGLIKKKRNKAYTKISDAIKNRAHTLT